MKKSTRVNMQTKRATQKGVLVGVRMQPEQLNSLDNWRREQDDLPNRPEAIRRLIAQTLNKT